MDISASLYMPLIKVNWKLQQSNPGRVAKDTKTPGLKVWVTPPGKKRRLVEVLTAGGGNTEWVAEEYQLS